MSEGERNKMLYIYHVSRDSRLYKIVCASEEEAMRQKTINERTGGIISKIVKRETPLVIEIPLGQGEGFI